MLVPDGFVLRLLANVKALKIVASLLQSGWIGAQEVSHGRKKGALATAARTLEEMVCRRTVHKLGYMTRFVNIEAICLANSAEVARRIIAFASMQVQRFAPSLFF